ncbi:MAG: hypothetical protein GY720_22510 [bacterium]|nr:hypothetical protein [bacterium]
MKPFCLRRWRAGLYLFPGLSAGTPLAAAFDLASRIEAALPTTGRRSPAAGTNLVPARAGDDTELDARHRLVLLARRGRLCGLNEVAFR